ncbi:MAG: lamin tail domain-containing protein [Bacteroidota bacterium]
MRKTLLFLILLSVKLTFGQFRDDFSDGNFNLHPSWTGTTSQFNINSSGQLQSLLSSVNQTISLSTASHLALNAKWEFMVQLKFDPSSTNFTRIYLLSDQQDLTKSLNGYFIQIGESGNTDSYDLYRQTGTKLSKIIDGPAKVRQNTNNLSTKLRITRDELGHWELYSTAEESNSYNLEGSAIDLTFTTTNWFGLYCKYTATRSAGFIFDDFKIEALNLDTTAPQLLSINLLDEHTMETTFSEALETSSALTTDNYLLSAQNEHPVSVITTSKPNVYLLRFASMFKSGNYTLTAINIKDLKANSIGIDNTASLFYIEPYRALKGDIVINEIYADPSPSLGLPAGEFVELWNTTDRYILLNGWKYADLTTTYTFATDTIKPNAYLILCANADVALFKPFGKTIGLQSWPSLNNDKDKLSLVNAQNVLINEVTYSDSWYKDVIKKQGGYSLELIDPKNKCTGIQNWQASKQGIGGTPGQKNSVYQLQLSAEVPALLTATIIDSLTIRIDFSKYIDSTSASLTANYKINNGIGQPFKALPQLPEFTSVLLQLSIPLRRGVSHLLTVNNLTDCAGNLINPLLCTATLFMAKEAGKNDILISEILVNPRPGGVDFVEIYNNTDHIFDLATLQLANISADGSLSGVRKVSTVSTYIPAQTFWVLTSNIEAVKQQYTTENPNNFTKMPAFPAYNNDKGTVVLLNENGIIDRFDYHEKMHLPLLQNFDGVSLERISFLKETNEPGNFKSAAQAIGFATPGYRNSQQENETLKNEVWLSHKMFSPDGDGFEDGLQIDYHFIKSGNLANIYIYNENGILVRRLLKNNSIANQGHFTWDGLNDAGRLNKIGIYVIKFDTFTLNGKTKSYKQACVLAGKL